MLCKHCLENKEESAFYPYNKFKCKSCCIKNSLKPEFKERRKKYQYNYYSNWYLKNGRDRAIDYQEAVVEWITNHPKEYKACQILQHAVKTGKIIKPKLCQKCKKEKRLSGHHEDYNKPLLALWLCSSCHKLKHITKVAST